MRTGTGTRDYSVVKQNEPGSTTGFDDFGRDVTTKKLAAGSVVLASTLVLTACGNDGDEDFSTASPVETVQSAEDAEHSVSDIQAAVDIFVGALDDLGIDHSEPERRQVGGSGAKAVFDIDVNGFDSGINVFPDADALETWQGLSDSFGGIHVAKDLAVLSLNTDEGIGDSAEIAPQIAEHVGGVARGV